MNILSRLKKLEMISGGDEFCAESCRKHPEITFKHQHDGIDCAAPGWMHRNPEKDDKKPISDVCPVCLKPTRKQTIILNHVTLPIKEN
jgi:hypothetical protein